jgi:hypothetical protein
MNLAAGAQLGPYEVVGLLGAGAMGEVYQARDHRLRRNVAVKVLPPAFSQDPDRLHRFEHEARAAGALNHPNVLAIHDVGSDGRARYLVSELLEGQTLRSRMADSLVAQRKVVEYAIQIARGLAAAHDKGIVHRDLKPENVFLTRDGGVKILDFGLAKLNWPACLADEGDATESLTEPGTVLGTVGYMSPEQVRGEIVDHRSDIFSLGTILYEMLAGRRPFQGKTAVETMNAILKEEPPRLSDLSPDLPPGLERIASHCLEKNAEERFQSARDLAFDMEALSHPSNPSVRALAHASARRRISLQAAALAAAVVGLPTAGYVARSAPSAIPTYHRLSYRRGVVGSARFSPDGQIVYSAAWEGKPMEAFATRPDLPEARSLGFGDAQVLSVSQPGEVGLILYRDDGRTLFARAPLAGGPPREVAEDVIAADESRDGSRVALLRRVEGRVRLEFPAGHTAYTAVGLSHPRLSPAGDRVAFLEHPLAGDDRGFVSLLDAA